jgi:hypothetical protein
MSSGRKHNISSPKNLPGLLFLSFFDRINNEYNKTRGRSMGEGPSYFTYLETIATHIAKGDEPEVIARKTNLDINFILKCCSDPQFDDVLKSIDPNAFKEWKQARAQQQAQARVKQMAREDAPENYKKLKELIESKVLDPKDEAAYLLKMIQIADVVGKGQEEEIIKLTPMQMQVIKRTLEET